MRDASEIPHDLAACRTLVATQAAMIAAQETKLAAQEAKLEELGVELEKVRKLLSHFTNGQRSEKRILTGPDQRWLPFENGEEFQVARAEAEAIVQIDTVPWEIKKRKKRDESLPSDLRRVEQIVVGDPSQTECDTHGERVLLGYDTTETLIYTRPERHVLVKKCPKYACTGHPECDVALPLGPTSLVEGERFATRVAATVVDVKGSLEHAK